jgi:hypothetical protein
LGQTQISLPYESVPERLIMSQRTSEMTQAYSACLPTSEMTTN